MNGFQIKRLKIPLQCTACEVKIFFVPSYGFVDAFWEYKLAMGLSCSNCGGENTCHRLE